nr:MAG TPA: hypothetical protein [Siphoviridae sp. ctmtD6]
MPPFALKIAIFGTLLRIVGTFLVSAYTAFLGILC